MPAKLSSAAILVGSVLVLIGLCILPAALQNRTDPSFLGLGETIFSLGTLTIASGIYLKARLVQSAAKPPASSLPSKASGSAGCELCGAQAAVVHCKVHQLRLCGHCLACHYDYRSCSFVPVSQTALGKASGAAMAVRRNA
jgi:hypothetical protein